MWQTSGHQFPCGPTGGTAPLLPPVHYSIDAVNPGDPSDLAATKAYFASFAKAADAVGTPVSPPLGRQRSSAVLAAGLPNPGGCSLGRHSTYRYHCNTCQRAFLPLSAAPLQRGAGGRRHRQGVGAEHVPHRVLKGRHLLGQLAAGGCASSTGRRRATPGMLPARLHDSPLLVPSTLNIPRGFGWGCPCKEHPLHRWTCWAFRRFNASSARFCFSSSAVQKTMHCNLLPTQEYAPASADGKHLRKWPQPRTLTWQACDAGQVPALANPLSSRRL